MNCGYIKIYRQLLNWEWYGDMPTKSLFLHCLLKANHKAKKWQGVTIKAGSFVTSYKKLSIETGLTVQQVRTALNRLKSTCEITQQTTSRFTVISIKNWVEYQEDNTQSNKRITNNQQTNNKQITTTKNDKNDKNEKNDSNILENKVISYTEKTQKLDPYQNPIIRIFKDEYSKVFNNKPYLTAIERNKIVELCADIEDFTQTIPVVFAKMKSIDFGFSNWKPTVSWLLKDSNYTAVLNGAYDKQGSKSALADFFREEKERLRQKGIY